MFCFKTEKIKYWFGYIFANRLTKNRSVENRKFFDRDVIIRYETNLPKNGYQNGFTGIIKLEKIHIRYPSTATEAWKTELMTHFYV